MTLNHNYECSNGGCTGIAGNVLWLYEVAELCGWIERWLGYFVKPMLSISIIF